MDFDDKYDWLMRCADEIRVRNNQKRNRYEEECRHSKNGGAEIPEPTYETEIEVPFSTTDFTDYSDYWLREAICEISRLWLNLQ